MRLFYQTSKIAIYDDVLEPDDFRSLWAYVQEEHYATPTANGGYTGGLAAFQTDIDIPLKYGVDQCVGDTICAGGIMYAQRTIPALAFAFVASLFLGEGAGTTRTAGDDDNDEADLCEVGGVG